jgi:hypothetical protein
MHAFAVDAPQHNGAQWQFDGSVECPTFSPSMNIRIGPYPDNDEGKQGRTDVCHYFLRAGKNLSRRLHTRDGGQEVGLPELPERYRK